MINLTDRISFYSRFVILWFILITGVDVCWWTAISIRTFRITNSWFTPPTLNLIANCFFSDSLDIFRPLEITNSWFTPKSWLNSICELLFQFDLRIAFSVIPWISSFIKCESWIWSHFVKKTSKFVNIMNYITFAWTHWLNVYPYSLDIFFYQLWIMNLITFCEKNKQICEYYELYHICVNKLIKCLSLCLLLFPKILTKYFEFLIEIS